jgi:hypothetical protein
LFVLNGDEKSYGLENNTIKRNYSTLAGKKSARRDRRNLHGVPSVPVEMVKPQLRFSDGEKCRKKALTACGIKGNGENSGSVSCGACISH